MLLETTHFSTETMSFDVSVLTEQARQELMDFYQFLLQRYGAAKPASTFPSSQLESPDTPSVYQVPSLTLADMDRAIAIEAGKHL